MIKYKTVAIELSLHRRAAMLAVRQGRSLGGRDGIMGELLEIWLKENDVRRKEEKRRDDGPAERLARIDNPG